MPQSNEFGRHECLDRAALARDFVARWLLEHEALRSDEHKLADEAHDALHALYNLIGKRHL